ncbi:hypothetical protein HK405_005170, partial [Cladochytrium tenue]
GVFDTSDLSCSASRPPRQRVALARLCEELGVTPDADAAPWHNAGNDAAYTLEAFLVLTCARGLLPRASALGCAGGDGGSAAAAAAVAATKGAKVAALRHNNQCNRVKFNLNRF